MIKWQMVTFLKKIIIDLKENQAMKLFFDAAELESF